ncbi:hypothetical protein, partial [Klebsiella pneumoniae]|uniref:hypothetical protein n=1 Tax=Klebsiella pneumoniae TaxID=573 RepID=UPI0025A084B4
EVADLKNKSKKKETTKIVSASSKALLKFMSAEESQGQDMADFDNYEGGSDDELELLMGQSLALSEDATHHDLKTAPIFTRS